MPVYKLKDDAGEILDGTFYEAELQKVIKKDDVYRVSKSFAPTKTQRISGIFLEMESVPRQV